MHTPSKSGRTGKGWAGRTEASDSRGYPPTGGAPAASPHSPRDFGYGLAQVAGQLGKGLRGHCRIHMDEIGTSRKLARRRPRQVSGGVA